MGSFQEINESAKGKWRGILATIGIDLKYLTKKHGPCPICHGKDRFRFDDKGGEGTWICSQCGSGYGAVLAQKYTGKGYRDVMMEIDEILNGKPIKADPVAPEITDEQRREALNKVWRQCAPMSAGNVADVYLRGRGVRQESYVADLRFGESLRNGEGGVAPCMVAMVRDPDGKPSSLHRTFLRKDGKGKAEMASPRKMMPGQIAIGSCVRLMEWQEGQVLGIAEGIETAFAASQRFKIPVWAALNANMLARWQWPDGCKSVMIFGDNDASFTGQAAAFELAKRAASRGLEVQIHIPGLTFEGGFDNTDFADMANH
jgi:putative DNA primase/helicase